MKYNPLFGLTGIQRGTTPMLTNEGEFYDTNNLSPSKAGVMKKSGDYALKSNIIVSGKDILGGIDFIRADGTHTHIVAVDGASNADIYIYDPTGVSASPSISPSSEVSPSPSISPSISPSGAPVIANWVAQGRSLTKGTRVSFAYSPTLDTLFATNGVDSPLSFNGTTWSTGTSLSGAPKGKYAFNFAFRMWLFNLNVNDTLYPTRGIRSSLVDEPPITWDFTNDYVEFDSVVNGVGPAGENMLVLCEDREFLVTSSNQRIKVGDTGCVSADSVVGYKNVTFWASMGGYNIWTGSESLKISSAVDDIWGALTTAQKQLIRAEVLNGVIYIWVGTITDPDDSNRTIPNIVLTYDISKNAWNRLSTGISITDFHKYRTSTGEALFAGASDGGVYEMFSGGSQAGAEFSSSFETHWNYGSGPGIVDNFRELRIYGEKLSGLDISYKVDDGGWEPLRSEISGSSGFCKFSKRAKRIKFMGSETSKSNPYEIHRIDIGYESGEETESDRKSP